MKWQHSFIVLAAAAITLGASLVATAKNMTWDGGGSGGNAQIWSAKQNWTNVTLAAGDSLFFAGSVTANNNNTPADTSYAGITFNTGASAFSLSGNRITLGGDVTNNSATLQSIGLNMILSATRTFNAAAGNIAVGGVISGSNGLTKTGSSVLTLTGANLYTGLTSISAGTLLANNTSGSATGTGGVSVGANGLLGGTGTITPTGSNSINVTGVLAPGASIGTLTFNLGSTTGTVSMNSGASFRYELGTAGLNIDSVGAGDLFSLAGAGASDFAFNGNIIDFLGTGGVGFYKLIDTSSNNANTWTGLTVNGSGLITGGLTVSNLAGGLSGNLIMGGNTLGGTSGDIYLHVVPEPTAALLGGIGVLLLLRRRRR